MTINLVAFDCGDGIPLTGNATVNSIITAHLETCGDCARLDRALDHRNQEYSDFAVMSDVSVRDLNRHPDRDWPLEISGDAIALHKETRS